MSQVLLLRVKADTSSFNRVPCKNMPVKMLCLAFERCPCLAHSESSVNSTIQSSSLAHGKLQANPETRANNPREQHN